MNLSYEERYEIEQLLKNGASCRLIADILNRSYSAIKKEVRVNGGKINYNAQDAEKKAEQRSLMCDEHIDGLIKSIVELYRDGKSYHQIGEILNLTSLQVQRGLLHFLFKEQQQVLEAVLNRLKKMEYALKTRGVYV